MKQVQLGQEPRLINIQNQADKTRHRIVGQKIIQVLYDKLIVAENS